MGRIFIGLAYLVTFGAGALFAATSVWALLSGRFIVEPLGLVGLSALTAFAGVWLERR